MNIFRRLFCCTLGIHSPRVPGRLTDGGECRDCGKKWAAISWPDPLNDQQQNTGLKTMDTLQAIDLARRVKSGESSIDREQLSRALVALLDHGDRVQIPDLETSVRMVAAHIHAQGKYYIEIAVDPQTKQVGWNFPSTDCDDDFSN